jgi:hypothetical protein
MGLQDAEHVRRGFALWEKTKTEIERVTGREIG